MGPFDRLISVAVTPGAGPGPVSPLGVVVVTVLPGAPLVSGAVPELSPALLSLVRSPQPAAINATTTTSGIRSRRIAVPPQAGVTLATGAEGHTVTAAETSSASRSKLMVFAGAPQAPSAACRSAAP